MNPFAGILYVAGAIALVLSPISFICWNVKAGVLCLLIYGVGLCVYRIRNGK